MLQVRDTYSGPSSSSQSGYAGTRLPQVRLLALLGVFKRPWSPRGRGEMAMAVPCCHPLYGTACAVGLTWRPLTGSLFLSSFWCRLKPGPSGERGRKSSLLQDMLDTGRPTCTTGGRSSRELTGNDPRTDRSRSTHKDGRPFLAGIPGRYAVVLTYYWVRRVTSLVGLFVFPFVLFVHFFVFRGPGAGASGHTGSLPGCVERGVLCPGGGKVGNQVKQTACRF